jgi:hypothetical protein
MFKEDLHQVLDNRKGITRGYLRSMQKRKNTSQVGKGSKQ